MMRYLTLDNILMHCRLERGAEDDYITHLGETAEEMTEKYLNRTLEELAGENGTLPRSIENTCYMIVADLYRNREASSTMQLHPNPALLALLRPYKRLI